MNDYKPGTVAVATVRGVPNVRVLRSTSEWWSAAPVVGMRIHRDTLVTDVRPLVVLDPRAYPLVDAAATLRGMGFFEWADRWAEQTQPPKPAEPTGLGAVVEDGNGKRWTRYDAQGDPQPWWCDGAGPDIPVERRFAYADIDAVRVLSDGVTA